LWIAKSPAARPTNVRLDGSGVVGGTKPPVEPIEILQPPPIVEAVSPAVLSKMYKLQVPFGWDPWNAVVKVETPCTGAQLMPVDGAGAGKAGQVVPNTVGRNDPERICPLVSRVLAVSVRMRLMFVKG